MKAKDNQFSLRIINSEHCVLDYGTRFYHWVSLGMDRIQAAQVLDGLQKFISPDSDLADCSLITSPYRAGDRIMGTVGIVGPTRMQYARAVALVDYLAQVLSRLLTDTDH